MPNFLNLHDHPLIKACSVWCTMTGATPVSAMKPDILLHTAVREFVASGKGFADLNDQQRRAIAGLDK